MSCSGFELVHYTMMLPEAVDQCLWFSDPRCFRMLIVVLGMLVMVRIEWSGERYSLKES